MNKILSKISELFRFIGNALTALDYLGLIFIILLSIAAFVYFLITEVF